MRRNVLGSFDHPFATRSSSPDWSLAELLKSSKRHHEQVRWTRFHCTFSLIFTAHRSKQLDSHFLQATIPGIALINNHGGLVCTTGRWSECETSLPPALSAIYIEAVASVSSQCINDRPSKCRTCSISLHKRRAPNDPHSEWGYNAVECDRLDILKKRRRWGSTANEQSTRQEPWRRL